MVEKVRRRLGVGLVSLALAVASGCGSTRTSVTQVWQAPAPTTQPMKSLIVLADRTDEANRRAIEDGIAAEIAEHGVKAVPSYQLFPGSLPEAEKAREGVKQAGFDGIFVVRMKDVRERQTYVPGSYTGGFWSGYYGPGWGYGSPGYMVTDEIVTFETTLWDTRAEDKLVWTALAKTTNPSTGEKFVESLAEAVVPKLEKARLIPPERD